MSQNTGFSNKGIQTTLVMTVFTYCFKSEGHVAVLLHEGTTKWLFRPLRIFHHQEGRYLCRAKTRTPARIWGMFMECRRQVADLLDRLIKH